MKNSAYRTRVLFIGLLGILLVAGLAVRARDSRKLRGKQPATKQIIAKRKPAPRREQATQQLVSSATAIAEPEDFSFSPEAEAARLGLRLEIDKVAAPVEHEPRYDQPDEAMKYYLAKRLPEGKTELPLERYFEGLERMRLMPQYSTALGRGWDSRSALASEPEQQKLGMWTALGPGNVGGRTRAILIQPDNPDVMYAGGVAGGVWKSTNAGGAWTPMADMLANIAVNTLAFDPKDFNTIYAGTGEGYFAVDNVRGAGIFKTTDAGVTWVRLDSTNNPDFYFVNDIFISPQDSKRIYAATRAGVFRSPDSGVSWTRVLSTTVQGGCYDLAARTDQTNDYLFVACGNTQQAAVYRNTDAAGAGSWDSVLSEAGMGRTVLAVAPSNQNVVYVLSSALSGNYQYGLHAFFRSTASGDPGSWVARVRNTDAGTYNTAILSNPASATGIECRVATANGFTGQSWYDLAIAVDPLDENRVWAGSIDLWRTDNGGATWGVGGFVYPLEGERRIHPDQHLILFHPQYNGTTNQRMFIGNDGGVWRTDNARAKVATGPAGTCNLANSDVRWTSLNNMYGVTQFYHGSVSPDGMSYFGGTQDNGTVRGTDATGANQWREINGADGGYGAVDFINPTTLYTSTQNTGIRKSTDTGATFSDALSGIGEAGLFITPIAMDPSEPRRLYTGGANLYRTTNGASLWVNAGSVRNVSLGGGTLSAVAVAPMDANRGLIGMSDGTLIRTDRLLTLSTASPPSATSEKTARPRTGQVSWVAFDPTNKDIVYATNSAFNSGSAVGHVFRSIDGGVTWTNIDGTGTASIPDIPVHCIVVDPSNTARLYVGTDLGVFVSNDGGATWSVENTGFANVVTEALVLNTVNGVTTLYAFTHGRGVYKVVANMSGCNYGISPTTRDFGRDGGDAVINVTVAPNGCNWNAQSNVPWIVLQPGSGGGSNGSVGMKVLANATNTIRAGTVSIAGRSFTVFQEGQPDLDAPTIAVTSPAGGAATVTASLTNITGTAADNIRVAAVRWISDRGLSGTAAGTTSWTIAGLPLAIGRNIITVTATDDVGSSASSIVTITANPPATAASVLATVAGTGTLGFSGDGGPAAAAIISRPIRMAFDEAGNLYFADFNNHRIRRIAPGGAITTVAGLGTAGAAGDGGAATAAQLNGPLGVAIDRDGNLFIADSGNHRIRRVTASTGLISTVAGTGTAGFGGDDGPATAAQMNDPENVAVDAGGNLYIADFNNHRIRRVATDGKITTIAGTGTAGFNGDGIQANTARLAFPNDVAVDGAGNVYISDNSNQRIRKVTVASGVITTIAGNGSTGSAGDGGPATAALLNTPTGIALDGAGNLFIADRSNSRVRRVGASDGIITTIAGSSAGFSPDGAIAVGARLNLVTGVAADPQGVVHLTDRDNFRIRKIVAATNGDTAAPAVAITAPTSNPVFATANGALALGGTASDNGNVAVVRWSNDRGGSGAALGTTAWTIPTAALQPGVNNITVTAWDANGNAGSAQLAVTFNAAQVIVTIAGTGRAAGGGDGGPAVAADLSPIAVAVDAAGNVYFTDSNNRRVRRIAPNGQITAFAGTGDLGSSGDGGPATEATFNLPRGLAVDAAGNVYIGDANTHRIRKVTTDGKITTVAGTGKGFGDYGGDGGPATQADLNGPQGVAVDKDGNLYIADRVNSRIRKVTAATGIIATIAGVPAFAFSGDGGPATQAELNAPTGVAVDAVGNVYIADQGNQRIRRINAADGKISTIAGTGVAGYNGDNILAKDALINLISPCHLTVDAAGDVIFADRSNHRIRKITMSTGIITTLVGNGVAGGSGDGGSPTGASLAFPTGVAVDGVGNLYIADNSNNRIRRTRPSLDISTVASVSAASFIPNGNLAADAIAAAFGAGLATGTLSANSTPLPTALSGTAVRVRDNLGTERLSPLFFVSAGQINFQIPNGTANGVATVTVSSGNGATLSGTVNIATVAPGLFAADATGQGVAAAVVLRRNAAGQDSFEPISRFDSATGRFVPVPIDLGPSADQLFLIVFGTAFRNRTALGNVTATIGGVNAPVLYAGLTPGLIGLDQANLQLDRALAGRGLVDVILTVDGKTANTVTLSIK
jgi:uncharacterized protein (TIGR03437 family)